ncbi:endothelin-converting enzyme [Terriglobus roseus DSM 18391]|uniref:Endothelin-converting enzyme n=1 Tax=Terriglobus roseus (strain DSM 18391 / NRRL B-41598 / KBS 63) TaxID=926566 RepID=I3ZME0_TERRK|nr:endothelin-converting enzyme [Terriglobus roseus DSM 18391]
MHFLYRVFASVGLAAVALSPAVTAQTETHGVNTAAMDRSVKPGDDFYKYANGTYVAKTPIPGDRSGVSAFSLLSDRALVHTTAIVTDPELDAAPADSDGRKIADLYKAYMDENAIQANGRATLDGYLETILAVKNRHDLATELGRSLRNDVDALNNTNYHTANLFGLWVAPGFNDPDHYAPYLLQGGLGLPTRDYYLSDAPRMKSILDAYNKHVANNFRMLGMARADARATAVVSLEKAIAQRQVSLADSENIEHANNPWSMSDFDAKAPGLDWKSFFLAAGLSSQKTFIVWQPSAFTAESALVASQPIDVWKDLLVAHFVDAHSSGISKAFADERFEYTKTITGTQQQRPRQQRAVGLVSAALGDAVGKIYAQQFFTAEEKAKVQTLVANLMTAFRTRLQTLTWMNAATRAEAITKLDALQVGIGYPDKWRSYAGLEIKPDDLLGDYVRDEMFEYRYAISQIGKPTDRKEWTMTPQTVNAVNLPLDNGLNFPAAILQPPFYDPEAPDAVNYGAIGAIIGHEISHTFDSEGAAFDSKGRVRNWWTPADLAHFNTSTAALAAQYDAYAPFPDLHLNGKQTLGENIADVAGLQAAYDAFHESLHGEPARAVNGLTGDQQFFLAFAQNYAGVEREAALRSQVLGDPHSPGMFRAATVRNVDGWYKAFDVKPGDALYLAPEKRVHIW